jgi:hypothetical protein
MPNGPLDDLFEAVRALPPEAATNAINELMRAGDITYFDAMDAKRAVTALREFVEKWDSTTIQHPELTVRIYGGKASQHRRSSGNPRVH